MIITKLMGGLGNQLFQYSAGKQLAYNQNAELKFDVSFFSNIGKSTPRDYKLSCFNIVDKIADKHDFQEVLGAEWFRPIKRRLWKMGIDLFGWNYFIDQETGFQAEIPKLKKPAVLHGYWQNELYFSNIRSVLLDEIVLKNSLITSKLRNKITDIQDVESVAVHVRRGDYNESIFHICPLQYYLQAIKLLKRKYSNAHFFVFSDDIEWCKKNFTAEKFGNFVDYVTGFKDYEDLWLMSRCKHQIIANSSFSWWAAWLNPNPQKSVIAPKQWFKDEIRNSFHTLPEEWIIL